MDTDRSGLVDEDLSRAVLAAFFGVYREFGFGFLETVYANAMAIVLRESGLTVIQQAPIEVQFRGVNVGDFRADLLIPGRLLIEVKSATRLAPAHDAQLVNYLKATGTRLGLLLNFGPRPQFRRKICG